MEQRLKKKNLMNLPIITLCKTFIKKKKKKKKAL